METRGRTLETDIEKLEAKQKLCHVSITSALEPGETETVGPFGLSGQPIELRQLSQLHKCMHRQLPYSHAHMQYTCICYTQKAR